MSDAITSEERNASDDVCRSTTSAMFRDRDCSVAQHPLHTRQCSFGPFIGLGFTTPESVLSAAGGHHFFGSE
jgi:hypothetical protein